MRISNTGPAMTCRNHSMLDDEDDDGDDDDGLLLLLVGGVIVVCAYSCLSGRERTVRERMTCNDDDAAALMMMMDREWRHRARDEERSNESMNPSLAVFNVTSWTYSLILLSDIRQRLGLISKCRNADIY